MDSHAERQERARAVNADVPPEGRPMGWDEVFARRRKMRQILRGEA